MVLYVTFVEENKEPTHKSLRLAWSIDKYSKNLQKFKGKGYIYFKINGKKDNIISFTCVKEDFTTKEFFIGSAIYKFLKEIVDKFVYAKLFQETAYFVRYLGETLSSNGKYKMAKIKIRHYDNELNVVMMKKDYDYFNYMVGEKIPIIRNTKDNTLRVDFLVLNELKK